MKEIARRIAALPKENIRRDRIVIITQGFVDTCLRVQIVVPVFSCFLLKRHSVHGGLKVVIILPECAKLPALSKEPREECHLMNNK